MHKFRFALPAIAAQLLLASAIPGTFAQSTPQPSADAGQQTRGIKSLSDQDVDDLLAGRGAGFAQAAELNGYLGPAHVQELREPLQLSDAQLSATEALMARQLVAARRIGRDLVASERSLDQAFGSHSADEASVGTLTATIARFRGELRAEHRRTHLAHTTLLTTAQVQRYAQLRGYAKPEAEPAHLHHHH